MTSVAAGPDRELRAEVRIDASPEQVWAALTDFSRMPAWSPELVRMVRLGRGEPTPGAQYVGINRRGPVVWPTRNRIVAVEPGRLLAWDTVSSGARWVYELQGEGGGTTVTQRRPVTTALTVLSRAFAPLALGGNASHADELENGMRATLEALKSEVESGID